MDDSYRMPEPMNSGVHRGDRVFAFVMALIGMTAGLFWFLVNSDGPNAVVLTMVSKPFPQLQMDAELKVMFFGHVGYSRTAINANAFQAEVTFWRWAPPILSVMIGALGGYFGGIWLSRLWFRRRTNDHVNPTSPPVSPSKAK